MADLQLLDVESFDKDQNASPLDVRGLTVAYGRKPALWSIDYQSPVDGSVAIIGPNGAGKSTFLKAVLGLVPQVSGEVRFFGEPLSVARKRIAYVPQRSSVDWDFPATAIDVVTMGLYGQIGWFKRVRRKHREIARARLDQVGMADFGDRQIGQLSGGQQQRVFLARALAQDAQIYFMDEPFAGVDVATEAAILGLLEELSSAGRSVFCVHHDLQTAGRYFDHALILNLKRVADGTVSDVLTPDVLQQAYGGRLAPTELADLRA